MTNTALLRERIDSMGIKYAFIAEALGLTRQGLDRKLRDGSSFKAYQMFILKDMLHLTNKEAREIFFAEDVEKTSTK